MNLAIALFKKHVPNAISEPQTHGRTKWKGSLTSSTGWVTGYEMMEDKMTVGSVSRYLRIEEIISAADAAYLETLTKKAEEYVTRIPDSDEYPAPAVTAQEQSPAALSGRDISDTRWTVCEDR